MVGLAAAGLNLAGVARASAAHCVPSWDTQPANVGPGDNELDGVAVTSACNVWAVGHRSNSSRVDRTLIERWNGKVWRVHRSASPGGLNGTDLYGVAAASSSNAWAVGDFSNGTSDQTLIEHWNGRSWKVQSSPDPGGATNDAALSAVAAVSPTDAWAVGFYYNGTADQTLILHWNGRKWRLQTSPTLGSSTRRNGSFAFRTGIDLTGVAATSSKNAWAVGFNFNGTANQTLVEHWNGKRWQTQPSLNPGGSASNNTLSAVAATSSDNAWAVGNYSAGRGAPEQTLVEHWNGRAWKTQTSPNPGGSTGTALNGVAATSPTNAWAVGTSRLGMAEDPPVVERWNGKSWRVQPSLDLAGSLFGVAATSPTNAWAVGDYYNGTASQTLGVHCC